MTNDELAARQLHNLNQALFGIAIATRQLLDTPADTAPHPALAEFDRVMQTFADNLARLTAMVHQANTSSGIILPN